MANTYGQELEAAFSRSMPPGARCIKLRTPAAPVDGALGWLIRHVDQLHRDGRSDPVPGWVRQQAQQTRYTGRQPFDFLVRAPALQSSVTVDGEVTLPGFRLVLGEHLDGVRPLLSFAVECKSIDGLSLPHKSVEDHQLAGLLAEHDAGGIAGLLVEFRVGEQRNRGDAAPVWFLPVKAYTAARLATSAKSIGLPVFEALGFRLWRNPDRGSVQPYLCVGRLLALLGADVDTRKEPGVADVARCRHCGLLEREHTYGIDPPWLDATCRGFASEFEP